jgi:hypothetical protein
MGVTMIESIIVRPSSLLKEIVSSALDIMQTSEKQHSPEKVLIKSFLCSLPYPILPAQPKLSFFQHQSCYYHQSGDSNEIVGLCSRLPDASIS